MALEEPLDSDVLSREGGLTFMAAADLRKNIERAGGLSIEFQQGCFGTGLVIRLQGAGGCSCG